MSREIMFNVVYMNSPTRSWSHPNDRSASGYKTLKYWTDLAQILEQGKIDGIFLADVYGVYDVFEQSHRAAVRNATQIPTGDPTLIIPAMASVTEHLTFSVTANLTYDSPLPFARRMSTLDHLTQGRVGWNIVTGYLKSTAKATGKQTLAPRDVRYAIADEYLEIVYRLWEESWGLDAVKMNREGGVFADPDQVRPVDFTGEHLSLEGIHIAEPSPQRTPVLFQAGASPSGQAFAAKHAEGIFLTARSRPQMKRTVTNIRRMAKEAGRSPDEIKVFAGIAVITGATDAEARAKHDSYRKHVSYEGALALVSGWTGVDFSTFDLDDKLTDRLESNAVGGITDIFTGVEDGHVWTVREVAEHVAIAYSGPLVVGSPSTVADELERWIDETGADGFNLSTVVAHETSVDFIKFVVPELQRRGRYKTEYRPGTYREKLFGRGNLLSHPHVGASFRQKG